ncbi:MarR family transcriptional regulator [Klebsiella pneumoniae subsp. pneumoniae]|nr:MarR family transcriptional regulator [Klebsiella pneumoniae subsp. pneumoniae]
MVRELGFMSTTLAPPVIHLRRCTPLLEVSMREMTAAQLVTLLGLEKSSVSRMVSRLLAAGELEGASLRGGCAREITRPDGKGARYCGEN